MSLWWVVDYLFEKFLGFRVDVFLQRTGDVNSRRLLVVELQPDIQKVSIDLLQGRHGISQHLEVIVSQRHWVVRQVNRLQMKLLQVVPVLFTVFKIVPIEPQFSEVLEMLEVFEASELVDSDVERHQLRVVCQTLNLFDLVLLHI